MWPSCARSPQPDNASEHSRLTCYTYNCARIFLQVQFSIDANFKLDDLLRLELHKFEDEVGEIVDRAQKEEKMEQGLAKLKVRSHVQGSAGCSLWCQPLARPCLGEGRGCMPASNAHKLGKSPPLDACQLGALGLLQSDASKLLDLLRDLGLQLHAGLHQVVQCQAQGFAQAGARLRPEPSRGSGLAEKSFKVLWPLMTDV